MRNASTVIIGGKRYSFIELDVLCGKAMLYRQDRMCEPLISHREELISLFAQATLELSKHQNKSPWWKFWGK